jgi:hypothetical protein
MSGRPNSTTSAPLAAKGNGVRPPNPRHKPPPLPMKVRLRLARLARVPVQNREQFCDLIQLPLRLVWKLDRRAQGTTAGAALTRAAAAARAFHESFAQLNEDDRKWVDGLVASSFEYQTALPALPRQIRELEHLFSIAVGKAPLMDAAWPAKDGKRKGDVKDLAFTEFIHYLVAIAEDWYGGQLTYDKNYETGTLIEAIDILRPYLPKRLAQTPLSSSTIRRIKSEKYYYRGFHGVHSYDE